MMARSSLMGCTLTETVRMLEPIGIDRWPIDLSHKYGMRDALTCSVGRRWLVPYWSSKSLHNVLDATWPYPSFCSGKLCRPASGAVDRP